MTAGILTKVTLIDETETVEVTFDYSWSEPNYMMNQLQLTWLPDSITDY